MTAGQTCPEEQIDDTEPTASLHYTWTVSHSVKMTVGQHEVLGATLRLQFHSNVRDLVIVTGEATQEVDAEGASGLLHIHSNGMGASHALLLDFLNLSQQVTHGHHLILHTSHWSRTHTGDAFQVCSATRTCVCR